MTVAKASLEKDHSKQLTVLTFAQKSIADACSVRTVHVIKKGYRQCKFLLCIMEAFSKLVVNRVCRCNSSSSNLITTSTGKSLIDTTRMSTYMGVVRMEDQSFSCFATWVQVEWDAIASRGVVRLSNGTEVQVFPSAEDDQGQVMISHKHVNWTTSSIRRMLGDFRQCSPCTCCDRSRRWCLPTVCCYNIRCGVRGLPFGLCSFVPISCTCFGCRS